MVTMERLQGLEPGRKLPLEQSEPRELPTVQRNLEAPIVPTT